MERLIYRVSEFFLEWSRKRLWKRKCTSHELGTLGICRRCKRYPLYGTIAYQKGHCLWYVEVDPKSDFDPTRIPGIFKPQYKKKEYSEQLTLFGNLET